MAEISLHHHVWTSWEAKAEKRKEEARTTLLRTVAAPRAEQCAEGLTSGREEKEEPHGGDLRPPLRVKSQLRDLRG